MPPDDCGRSIILLVTMPVVALALIVAAVAVVVYYCRKYAKLKVASLPAVDIHMPHIVETNFARVESNATTTTSEASSHIQTQSSVTGTEIQQVPPSSSMSGYHESEQKLDLATFNADDAKLNLQESSFSQTEPHLLSNRGLINQSPAREESTARTISETSSHGGSVHPHHPTPEITLTDLQEEGPPARRYSSRRYQRLERAPHDVEPNEPRVEQNLGSGTEYDATLYPQGSVNIESSHTQPPDNRSPIKQRPSPIFQTKSSIPESPLEQSWDAQQDQSTSKSVEEDRLWLHQTSWHEKQQKMGDSEKGTKKSGLPGPIHSFPRILRSQSLFTGSPPKTLQTSYERSSWGRHLSDQSQKRRSIPQRSKTDPEETESLLKGSATFQVGDDKEEHSDNQS